MSDSSTVSGTDRPSRPPKEEPDLWQEDDIPTDDGGEPGTAREEERSRRESPSRENEAPRE